MHDVCRYPESVPPLDRHIIHSIHPSIPILTHTRVAAGKKEVPQLARMAGRGTGKMVALLNTAREQFTKATQDTQLSKVRFYL